MTLLERSLYKLLVLVVVKLGPANGVLPVVLVVSPRFSVSVEGIVRSFPQQRHFSSRFPQSQRRRRHSIILCFSISVPRVEYSLDSIRASPVAIERPRVSNLPCMPPDAES